MIVALVDPMPVEESGQSKRALLLIIIGLLILLGATSVTTASVLEERDQFCASCHMVPERTYFNRAQFAQADVDPSLDLASDHYATGIDNPAYDGTFRCIDCHRGNHSIGHRVTALTLGLRDAGVYVFGNPNHEIEKTETLNPDLIQAACLNCHEDSLLTVGFPNHFHNALPQAHETWQNGRRTDATRYATRVL